MDENTLRNRLDYLERQVFGCTNEEMNKFRIDFTISDSDVYEISRAILKFDPKGSHLHRRIRFIQSERGLSDLQLRQVLERIKAMYEGRYFYDKITEPHKVDFKLNWSEPFTSLIELCGFDELRMLKTKIDDIWRSLPEYERSNITNLVKK